MKKKLDQLISQVTQGKRSQKAVKQDINLMTKDTTQDEIEV